MRKSGNYPGPHFLWGRGDGKGRIRTLHYVPTVPKRRVIPPLLFDGRIMWGDLNSQQRKERDPSRRHRREAADPVAG